MDQIHGSSPSPYPKSYSGMPDPPPPAYNSPGYNSPGYNPNYYSTPMMTQPAPAPAPAAPAVNVINTQVSMGGNGTGFGCPVCHNNNWTGTYSCCAWLCCICLFPIGIVCCLCMRKKKCTKCGFTLN